MNELESAAKLYVDHKGELIQLMQDHGAVIPAGVTHGQLTSLYFRMLRGDPDFADAVERLITIKQVPAWVSNIWYGDFAGEGTATGGEGGGGFFSKLGGILGGAIAPIGAAIGGVTGLMTAREQREAQQEAFFQEMVLNEQRKGDNKTVLLIVGGSVLLVGVGLLIILRKK